MIDNAVYDPMDDGIALVNTNLPYQTKGETNEALIKVLSVIQNRPKSIIVEVNTYRKYIPKLINYIKERDKLLDFAIKQIERYENDCDDKRFKRWTPEEEEMLINLVCDENYSMLQISTMMGRTVPSIKTKISNLVGVKRLSQKIAGRFIGTMNGENIETNLNGIIYKEENKNDHKGTSEHAAAQGR